MRGEVSGEMSDKGVAKNLQELPLNLPVPVDDDACRHLTGAAVPSIALSATSGRTVVLSGLAAGRAALFFYPRTGMPGEPAGPDWDAIPGARG